MAAIIWLVLGLVLIAAEMASGDFVLVMLGVGALGAAGAAALGANLVIGAVVFALLSAGLIAGVRPAIKRRFQSPGLTATNVDALVGKEATVLNEVNRHEGRVKIGGDVWSARCLDSDEVLASGEAVTVVEISGATAVVTNKW